MDDQIVLNVDLRIAREQLHLALLTRLDDLNAMLAESLEKALTPDAIHGIVDRQVSEVLDKAVREEITNFLLYGEGRRILRTKVAERLTLEYPE